MGPGRAGGRAGPTPGRYFVAARIRDDHGQVIEDTVMVAVGERRWPDPELPPEEALELMQADFMARRRRAGAGRGDPGAAARAGRARRDPGHA